MNRESDFAKTTVLVGGYVVDLTNAQRNEWYEYLTDNPYLLRFERANMHHEWAEKNESDSATREEWVTEYNSARNAMYQLGKEWCAMMAAREEDD